jgi:hypothetical protein
MADESLPAADDPPADGSTRGVTDLVTTVARGAGFGVVGRLGS